MAERDTKRVLIVDDDTAVLRIMRESLQNLLQW
jgi:CheY-like chemotaxis protein